MLRCVKLVIFLVVILCATAALGQSGISDRRPAGNTIRVQVRLPGGRAAPQGIMVMLEEQGSGVVAQGQTDSLGKYVFNPGNPEVYRVIVKQVGYYEATAEADLKTSQTAYLMIELKPLPGNQPTVPGGIVPADLPEKAVKEYKQGEKLLMHDQNIEASIEHLRKAVQLAKNFTDAYVMLGFAYLAQKNPGDAKPVLQKAVELNPKSSLAHIELGAAYNLEKHYADAERELLAGLALNDSAAEGQYEIAKTYWETQRWGEAEAHAAKAIALAPDFAAAHVLLGNAELRNRNYSSAKHHFQEYLRIEPNGPMAAGVRNVIANIDRDATRKYPQKESSDPK